MLRSLVPCQFYCTVGVNSLRRNPLLPPLHRLLHLRPRRGPHLRSPRPPSPRHRAHPGRRLRIPLRNPRRRGLRGRRLRIPHQVLRLPPRRRVRFPFLPLLLYFPPPIPPRLLHLPHPRRHGVARRKETAHHLPTLGRGP